MSNVDTGELHRCTDRCSEGHTYTLPGCAHPSAQPAGCDVGGNDIKPDWDDYFLGIATAVARRSGCHRANVGAVIVSPDRIIQATGYNDAPPGRPGCDTCPHRLSLSGPGSSAYEPCVAVHAEANAIIYAGRSGALSGTIYVTTRPCDGCKKLIQAAGIVRIVCPDYTQTVIQPHIYEAYRQRVIVGWQPGAGWSLRVEGEQEDGGQDHAGV